MENKNYLTTWIGKEQNFNKFTTQIFMNDLLGTAYSCRPPTVPTTVELQRIFTQ